MLLPSLPPSLFLLLLLLSPGREELRLLLLLRLSCGMKWTVWRGTLMSNCSRGWPAGHEPREREKRERRAHSSTRKKGKEKGGSTRRGKETEDEGSTS